MVPPTCDCVDLSGLCQFLFSAQAGKGPVFGEGQVH